MTMSQNRQIDLALWAALISGCLLRFMPGFLTGFPVNDGGMLIAMIRDLQSNRFFLPVVTSYNYSNIPFAYPPFGLYVAAFLHSQFAISEFEIVRWLPPLVSSATIPAFYWLASEITDSKPKAAIAALLYALIPGVSDWLVMGGGLTRSFGILFSLLTIGYTYRLFRSDPRAILVGLATLFSSLTVLSHPEVGLQTASICFLLWVCYGRNRSGIKNALLISFGVALLTAVWWVTVLRYHSVLPFQSAMQTGIHETLLASLFHTFFSMQGRLPVLPVFALTGIFAVLRRREVLLVLWAFLPFFVDPRNAPAVAIFPFLMLASEGIYYLYLGFRRAQAETFAKNQRAGNYVLILIRGTFAGLLLYLFLVSFARIPRLSAISLTASDRETMQWVRQNTPPESRFLLMTNSGNISPMTDSYQEWFPALAERQSVNTLQGMEWILASKFFPYSQELVALQSCPDAACLNNWLEQNGVQVDFILFQTEHANQRLINSLRADKRYDTVYESGTAEMFIFRP